jgi:uncharacterized protein (DUF2141 family)
LVTLLALMGAAAQPQIRTPDQACLPGQPSLTVEVSGFVNDNGTVRAQLYGPGGARFLDKGQWAMRIEQRRQGPGPMRFCFPITQPGDYAVAVRHDANANGKSDWNDGVASPAIHISPCSSSNPRSPQRPWLWGSAR